MTPYKIIIINFSINIHQSCHSCQSINQPVSQLDLSAELASSTEWAPLGKKASLYAHKGSSVALLTLEMKHIDFFFPLRLFPNYYITPFSSPAFQLTSSSTPIILFLQRKASVVLFLQYTVLYIILPVSASYSKL